MFSVSELAAPGAEVGRISATDADLGENARLEYTILEGESGDTFSITGVNQEAIITLTKVRCLKKLKNSQYVCELGREKSFLECFLRSESISHSR